MQFAGIQAVRQEGPSGSSLDNHIFIPAPAEVGAWIPESHRQPLHQWLSSRTHAVPPEHALLFIAVETGYEFSKPSSLTIPSSIYSSLTFYCKQQGEARPYL